MNNIIATGSLEGPRWADIPGFLKSLCLRLDIDLKIVERKRWFTSDIVFRITGDESRVSKAMELIKQSMDTYNEN